MRSPPHSDWGFPVRTRQGTGPEFPEVGTESHAGKANEPGIRAPRAAGRGRGCRPRSPRRPVRRTPWESPGVRTAKPGREKPQCGLPGGDATRALPAGVGVLVASRATPQERASRVRILQLLFRDAGRETFAARGGSGAESSCRDIKNATVVDYRNFWPQLRTFSVLLSCPAVPSRRPLPAERATWGPHNLSGGSRRPSAQRRLPRGRPGGRLGRQRKCAVHTACSHPSVTVAAVSPAQRDVAKLFPPAGWQTTLAAKPPKHVS